MLRREPVELPERSYPREPWRLVESRFHPRHTARTETVFALSNGYLGVRGTHDDGRPVFSPGTFVNGFHETWPITHAEEAYGLARTGQTIVNVPDASALVLFVDDEPLVLPVTRVREYGRVLDMRAGTLTRELLWSTPAGKHVRVRSTRLVSLHHRHLMAIDYEVTVLDHAAPVVIRSMLVNHQDRRRTDDEVTRTADPRLGTVFPRRVLDLRTRRVEGGRFVVGYRTVGSGMTLGIGVDHRVQVADGHDVTSRVDPDLSETVIRIDAAAGVPLRVTKYVAYHTSRSAETDDLADRCERTLDRAADEGFTTLLTQQRAELDRFWERADVQVDERGDTGDSVALQQAVRWNLFQIAQATWRAEGSGVPAKGLTSPAYEGHYFWDTEMYVLPFLCYTQPRIARNLLRFRHDMLPRARHRADELDLTGAAFPWRTINGEEASAYYEAGTAQFHLNADIAYALRRYVDVRGDPGFLAEAGAELLVESARMWADLGFYGDDGAFHIHGVTGPDEYTTVVDDNAYTNLMARENLRDAASVVERIRRDDPAEYAALADAVGLRPEEAKTWRRAAAAMAIPYDEQRGIHPQDAAFLDREVWDLDSTPREKFPLLLHYHPLVIYRRQVVKQADVVLAMFLLGDEFTAEQKRRNFEYYERLTTGDSSLSACVQAIVAAEIGEEKAALDYFRYALLMDLGDVAGNVANGVHIASAGGVWMALAYGFAGLRDRGGELAFTPRLPTSWARLRLPLRFRDRQLEITLTERRETYRLVEGEPLDVTVRGHRYRLTAAEPLEVSPPSSPSTSGFARRTEAGGPTDIGGGDHRLSTGRADGDGLEA
ncbi:glycoside hydrolase family 65 protein [Jiangella rhizosphaerae]|uniref:Glycoside hydrolase family 65 protein n=1 Tax=Jiangella rhizosphaerae TaxID=2293569 RepID=A0A418KKX8_9ACTN|nr:glycosyl hydrolase family 65 protein [Jiangella rhizosphaerae]RIQ18226.1 glycoside hydrolase family 65 protein [Jiangella rhizosphaerae]